MRSARTAAWPPDARTARSYALCSAEARRQARNFYYGFRLLPPPKRAALCAFYAFMRRADDLADGAGVVGRAAALDAWRASLYAALDDGAADDPILPALRDAVTRYAVPPDLLGALVSGAAMDLEEREYATFADLERYCYHVAGVVGLVCLHVWGVREPERAHPLGVACGTALQLTNILRDLREDGARGRVYLPTEDLVRFGCTRDDLLRGTMTGSLRDLVRFEAQRARDLYRRVEPLASLIEPDSRACFCAMVGIYRALLERIGRQAGSVLDRRISVPVTAKCAIVASAMLRARAGRA